MSQPDLAALGLRIRNQRTNLGYTREFLAEQIGVTPKFCADIELGQKGMSLQTLCRVARVLHLSTDYILFGFQERPETEILHEMLAQCPPEKTKYAEDILKAFLLSL